MQNPVAETRHRHSYHDPELRGRDLYIVRAVGSWVEDRLDTILAGEEPILVLDVGCGEQPWRASIESRGAAYVGMDIEQNSVNAVDVLGAIDGPLPASWPAGRAGPPYPVVLCTEVLEHVADWHPAWSNLRALVAPHGLLIVTVPFLFPLHLEPHDYHRATVHAMAALAGAYGFEVVRLDRLGSSLDVLATVLADLSILPERPTLGARLKARGLRWIRRRLLAALEWQPATRGLVFNSNLYLSNAAVLRRL